MRDAKVNFLGLGNPDVDQRVNKELQDAAFWEEALKVVLVEGKAMTKNPPAVHFADLPDIDPPVRAALDGHRSKMGT